jgi:hypothetical protein
MEDRRSKKGRYQQRRETTNVGREARNTRGEHTMIWTFQQSHAFPRTTEKQTFEQYSAHCIQNQLPLIFATTKGRLHAEIDCIACPEEATLSALSQEKVRTVRDAVSSGHNATSVGEIYSYAYGITRNQAEYLIQAYWTIYQQQLGSSLQVPQFPAPDPRNTVRARMAEAKERHFVHTRYVSDELGIRWDEYCRVSRWPCIQVHEARSGLQRFR